MSYNAKVYRTQGGNQLVVASTGNITVESGGGVEFDSGAQLRIEDGATLSYPVIADTTSTALSNCGVSTITKGTTGTGVNTYTMDAPSAGVPKFLNVKAANSSEHIIISGNTNVTYDGGEGSKDKLKIILPGLIHLIGVSTSAWCVAGSTVQVFPTS